MRTKEHVFEATKKMLETTSDIISEIKIESVNDQLARIEIYLHAILQIQFQTLNTLYQHMEQLQEK